MLLNTGLVYEGVSSSPSDIYNVGLAIGIAVYEDEAFPVKVEVRISDGSGWVSVEGVSYDKLFYDSIRGAVYEATWILGKVPYEYNYTIYVHPKMEVSYFTGTSLSLAVYIATLSAFTGISYRQDILLTGTINPDSTVGFVGKIMEKVSGAEEYNYSAIVIPMYQDRKYEIKEETIHIGPYVFSTKEVEVEFIDFNSTKIKIIQVATGLDAFFIGINEVPEDLMLRPYTKVDTTDKAIDDRASVLYNYLLLIENRTSHLYDKIEDIRQSKNIRIHLPLFDTWVENRLYNISLYLDSSAYMREKGFYFAAMDYLTLAYGTAIETYYLLQMVFYPHDAIDYIVVDYKGMEARVYSLILRITENYLNPDSMLLLSEACRLFYQANKESRIYIYGLYIINNNGAFNSVAVKSSIANALANAVMKLTQAEALALICLSTNQNGEMDLNKAITIMLNYGSFLSKYSYDYSAYTRVRSDIISLSLGNIWKGRSIWDNGNGNATIYREATLGYILKGISYASLYFNLHPGFKDILPSKLNATLYTLTYYLNITGGYKPTMVQSMLERALIYESDDSRVSFIESAITYLKAYLVLKHLSNIREVWVGNGGQSQSSSASGSDSDSAATSSGGWFVGAIELLRETGVYAVIASIAFIMLVSIGKYYKGRRPEPSKAGRS
jgi:hypothetical protein